MSRSKRIGKGAASVAASDHARHAAERVKPYASGALAAAGRGVYRARELLAPRVERTGQAVKDTAAPKVSAMLSSAARRIEPAKPPRRSWRKLAGLSLVTAAASAAAAVLRNRAKPGLTAPADVVSQGAAPATESGDEQTGTSTDTDAAGPVRKS